MGAALLGQHRDVDLLQLRWPLGPGCTTSSSSPRSARSRTTAPACRSSSASTRNRPPPDTAPDSAARTSDSACGDAGRRRPQAQADQAALGAELRIGDRRGRMRDDDRRAAEPVGDHVRGARGEGEHDLGRREHRVQVGVERVPGGRQPVHGHHERQAEPADRLRPALPGEPGHGVVAAVQVQDVDLGGVRVQMCHVQPRGGLGRRPHPDGVDGQHRVHVGIGVRDRRHPDQCALVLGRPRWRGVSGHAVSSAPRTVGERPRGFEPVRSVLPQAPDSEPVRNSIG